MHERDFWCFVFRFVAFGGLCFDRVLSGLTGLHLFLCCSHILQVYAQGPGRLICADCPACFSRVWLVRGTGRISEEEREVMLLCPPSPSPESIAARLAKAVSLGFYLLQGGLAVVYCCCWPRHLRIFCRLPYPYPAWSLTPCSSVRSHQCGPSCVVPG